MAHIGASRFRTLVSVLAYLTAATAGAIGVFLCFTGLSGIVAGEADGHGSYLSLVLYGSIFVLLAFGLSRAARRLRQTQNE